MVGFIQFQFSISAPFCVSSLPLYINFYFREKKPYKFQRKTNRIPVSPERMKQAVKEVTVDGRPLRTTAKKYNIDKMTLRRYSEKYKKAGEETIFYPNFASKQIFSNQEERLLIWYLLNSCNMTYGLTTREIRDLVYVYGVKNKVKVPEKWKNKETASRYWLRYFLSRYENLFLRTTEPTGFNRYTLHFVIQSSGEKELGPDCDETDVQTSHKSSDLWRSTNFC